MQGLSPVPDPPRSERRESAENQFSLAQLLSLIFAICVVSSLVNFALNPVRSAAPVWMALVGWLAAVTALFATRLFRSPLQLFFAGLVAVVIAALAMAV
ncbi:MAG TPA: hypothetical protein VFB96_13055 [Pirellulaceae bacterium]|nr:hypothetical protein [Pirellulaceae bacterium]